jgi:hypothetical protein
LSELANFLEFDEESPTEQLIYEVTLSQKTQDNLETILGVLTTELLEKQQKVLKSNNMNETQEFADILSKLATTYEIEHLEKYAQSLKDAIEIFDIMGIRKLLQEYEKEITLLS